MSALVAKPLLTTLDAPVFLSYSRVNREVAAALYAELGAASIPLWRDVHDIPAGATDWWGEIRAAIDGCSTMILCLSLAALRSTVVSDEWNYARGKGKRIIPVIVDEVFQHPDVLAGNVIVPLWMRNANWLDLRVDAPERAAAVTNLITTLQTPYTPKTVHITVKASQLPYNFVPRSREFEPLVEALAVETPPDAVALTATLRGAGGYGKTTLAKALCRDWRVSGAFPDGIYWVTLGEKLLTIPPNTRESELVARIVGLITQIAPTFPIPSVLRLEAATELLANVIASRRVLIVIDDAWADAHVKPFLVPGKHHATVITTRFDECIPRGPNVVRHSIDQMDIADALRLLAFGVDNWEVQRTWFERTVERLGRSAQLLGIINSALTDRLRPDDKGRIKPLPAALTDVDERLDAYGVTAFQPEDPEERERAFGKTLEVGIERLKSDEQTRYRLLGIIPDDVPVPLTMLAALWGIRHSVQVRDFCEKLAKSSLVQDYDERTLTLHDVTLKYLRDSLADRAAKAHAELLDAWGDSYTLPDDYAWRDYAYHLLHAGRADRLRVLLLDYRWLQAKLDATDVNALIADCDTLLRLPRPAQQAWSGEGESAIHLLHQALTLSAKALALDKRTLASQILARTETVTDAGIAVLRAGVVDDGALRFVNCTPPLAQAGGNLLAVMSGHTGYIQDALALRDGTILSWSKDGTLRHWNLDGVALSVLQGHTSNVWGALVLDDGTILSWSLDGTLRRWSLEGAVLAVMTGHMSSVEGALALDDGTILSWSRDGTLRRWNRDGGTLAVMQGHTESVNGALALDDGTILSWSDDGTLRRWNRDGAALVIMTGHTESVSGTLVLNDGTLLSWSGTAEEVSSDNTLRRWNRDGVIQAVMTGHTSMVTGALALDDGTLLSWSGDGTLRQWDRDGRMLSVIEAHLEGGMYGAMALDDGTILSWPGFFYPGPGDNTLRHWSHDGAALAIMEGHAGSVYGALVLRDGTILSWSEDGTLLQWNRDGTVRAVLEGHSRGVSGALILDDSTILSWSEDGTLRRWSLHGTSLPVSEGHPSGVSGALVLDDGTLFTWSYDGTLRRWNRDGAALAIMTEDWWSVGNALPLDDGTFLSWGHDLTLRRWNRRGVTLAVMEGHTGIVDGALVLDDGTLLSWAYDYTLRRWNGDGATLAVMSGHTGNIMGVLTLNDGTLLSWSADGTLRRWSYDGAALATMEGHIDTVLGVLALTDGTLVSWSLDGTVRRWNRDGTALAVMGDANAEELWISDETGVAIVSGAEVDWVNGVFELDDGTLLSCPADGTLRRWNGDGEMLSIIKGHTRSPDGVLGLDDRTLLSWAADGTLRHWNRDGASLGVLETGSQDLAEWDRSALFTWASGQGFDVNALLTLLGDIPVTGGRASWRENAVYVYSATDGRTLASFVGDAPITKVVVLPGDVIVMGDSLGHVLFLQWIPPHR